MFHHCAFVFVCGSCNNNDNNNNYYYCYYCYYYQYYFLSLLLLIFYSSSIRVYSYTAWSFACHAIQAIKQLYWRGSADEKSEVQVRCIKQFTFRSSSEDGKVFLPSDFASLSGAGWHLRVLTNQVMCKLLCSDQLLILTDS